MNHGDRYEELLDRWEVFVRTQNPAETFVRDGIINETLWRTAPQRIMFLLKENNCAPNSVSANAPLAQQRDFRLLCNERPWAEIGQWAYGLLYPSSNPEFAEANEHRDRACRQIAIVNLKKTPGDNTSSNDEIKKYALRDKELLQEQIVLLHPDIVVCCGKDFVFPMAQELFEDAQSAEEIASRPLPGCRNPIRVFQGSCRAWVDFIHPSMRRGSRQEKYENLMELCRSTM